MLAEILVSNLKENSIQIRIILALPPSLPPLASLSPFLSVPLSLFLSLSLTHTWQAGGDTETHRHMHWHTVRFRSSRKYLMQYQFILLICFGDLQRVSFLRHACSGPSLFFLLLLRFAYDDSFGGEIWNMQQFLFS